MSNKFISKFYFVVKNFFFKVCFCMKILKNVHLILKNVKDEIILLSASM